jgi:hypothetical protein
VSVLIALLTVVLLAVVMLVISAPLRAARRPGEPDLSKARGDRGRGDSAHGEESGWNSSFADRAELETAREAKYGEIRDAELDYRTGKLSREDYESVDRALRSEAIEILNRLEAPGEDEAARG